MSEAEIITIEAQWTAHHRSEEKRKALAGLVEPTMDRLQCDQLLAQWDAYDRWVKCQELTEHLTNARTAATNGPTTRRGRR